MTGQTELERLLTIEQAAEIMGLSVVHTRRFVADGRLPSVRFGRRAIRIRPSDLAAFIEERTEGGRGDED